MGCFGSEVEGFGRELVDLFTKLDGFMREVVDFWADDTDLGTDVAGFAFAANRRFVFCIAGRCLFCGFWLIGFTGFRVKEFAGFDVEETDRGSDACDFWARLEGFFGAPREVAALIGETDEFAAEEVDFGPSAAAGFRVSPKAVGFLREA